MPKVMHQESDQIQDVDTVHHVENPYSSKALELSDAQFQRVLQDLGRIEGYEHISTRTLQQVLRHDLSPNNIRHLQQPTNSKLHDLYPVALGEYSNLEDLLPTLQQYFDLLHQFHVYIEDDDTADDIARGVVRYMAHLRMLNELYAWRTVLIYHMAFHELRRREMKRGFYGGWLTGDPDLMKRVYDLEESGAIGNMATSG